MPSSRHTADVRPSRGLFDLDLKTLWSYRELLQVLVVRDLKVRYRQAALGVAWVVIQPLFAVLIFTVIFGMFAKMPSGGVPYPVFAYAALLPWTYFAEALRRGSTGLVAESELVRKIYFPRLIIPLASVIAPLVDFAIASVVMFGLMAWYHVAPTWNLLAIPGLVLIAMALAFSVSLWLGPFNVRFRDVMHTLPFLIQIWMYASPVIYPLSMVPEKWRDLYSLNPMVGVIEGFRWALLGKGDFSITSLTTSVVVIAVMLVGGLVYFKKSERAFADII